MQQQLSRHKFNIFPEAGAEDFSRLLADMEKNGFDAAMPVTLYQGAILDGWNRHRAAVQLGITPQTTVFLGDDTAAVNYTLRTNKRRNLSSSQWAAVAVEADELLTSIRAAVEVERRVKISEARQNGPQVDADETRQLIAQSADDQKTAHKAAELFNTNRTYINEAAKLKESSPDAFERVKSGAATITQVKREIKEKKREARREENRAKVAEVAEPGAILSVGAKFSTIMIDPPWDWGDEGDKDQLGRAKPDYSTMSIEDLMLLPIPDLADVDSHLYMWITNRSLPKGFALMEKWGFRYITALTWVKPSFGMGNYFRGQTEHILFGVKGSQMLKRKDVGTVFNAPRGPNGHSSKPHQFYELVESCSPGPYLEMFSRSSRADWTTWGENSNVN